MKKLIALLLALPCMFGLVGCGRTMNDIIENKPNVTGVDEKIETISGLKMDGTQKYVFFIPPQNETGPYSLPLTMHDKKTDSVALLTVVIEQTEDGYTARIDELTTYERKEAQ